MGRLQQYGAEFVGTLLLVFAGVGSAVFARNAGGIIVVGLAFGLAMFVLAYALSPVSGAHLNPAVTLGALLGRTISPVAAVGYWVAQVLGGIAGAFLVWVLVHGGGVLDETGALGSNSYGPHINLGGTALLEFVLTFLFVLVALLVTGRREQRGIAGAAIGLALGLANLVAIPLDGASINPARSIGPALFTGGTPLRQVWAFIVFPLLGGLAAAAVAPMLKRWQASGDLGEHGMDSEELARRRQSATASDRWGALNRGDDRTRPAAPARAVPAKKAGRR